MHLFESLRIRRMAQLVLALVLGLALLTWGASSVVRATAREWFERDVNARARLVLVGAKHSLATAWYADPAALKRQLMELERDERVMGVAVCATDFTLRASTPGFPEEFGCWQVGSRVRAAGLNAGGHDGTAAWSSVVTLPAGRAFVSAMPVSNQNQQLGFAILLHDLSYIERREAQAQKFLLIAFGFLAVMALGVPMFVTKWAR